MNRGLPPGGRILVVKLSSLGDLFHALPAVQQIRAACGVGVDWVTQPEYAPLVRCFRCVDRVLEFPRRRWIAGLPAFWRDLRATVYDGVVDLQGLLKSAVVARLARTSRRIGPSFAREGAGWFYSECAAGGDPGRHAVDRVMDTVRWLGLAPAPGPCALDLPPVELSGERPWIAMAPCSRWPTKNWPAERFAEVAQRLGGEVGGTVFLVGGGADRETCARIAAGVPGARDLCGHHGLPETASILAQMDLAITVDTGPMHMAAAVGVPVLAIFGPTDPGRTGPVGAPHRVVRTRGLDCQPCFRRTCARGDLACLDRIRAGDVAGAATALLGGSQS